MEGSVLEAAWVDSCPGVAALSAGAIAQSPAELDKALAPAPRNIEEGADGRQWWKADGTSTTPSGRAPTAWSATTGRETNGQQPFAVQCTSIANLRPRRPEPEVRGDERQGRRRQAAIDAAEKDGTARESPSSGSVRYTMSGADQATRARYT